MADERASAELLILVNDLRKAPAAFGRRHLAPTLERYSTWEGQSVVERGDGRKLAVAEGPAACEGAIAALEGETLSLWPLAFDEDLAAVAAARCQTFVDDPASHRNGGGGVLAEMVEARGEWSGGLGESAVDNEGSPTDVLTHLLVGDGDRERVDRGHVLSCIFRAVGVACATYDDAFGDTKRVAALVFASAFAKHPPRYAVEFEGGTAPFLGLQLASTKILGGPAAGRAAPTVKALAPGGQAEERGVLVGSRVVSANGIPLATYDDAMQTIKHLPRPLTLVLTQPVAAP